MTTWKTKSGEILQIADMSREHIENCLTLLRDNAKMRNAFLEEKTSKLEECEKYIEAFEAQLSLKK